METKQQRQKASEFAMMPFQEREKRQKFIEKIEEVLARRDATPHLWKCLKDGGNREDIITALKHLKGGVDLDSPKIVKVLFWLELS